MSDKKHTIKVDGHKVEVTASDLENMDVVHRSGKYHILNDDQSHTARLVSKNGKHLQVMLDDVTYDVKISDSVDTLVEQMGMDKVIAPAFNNVKAPMPGLVLDILVEPGQAFAEGEPLLILEAMKMENVLKAAGNGTVKEIMKTKGDTVEKGQVIIEMV